MNSADYTLRKTKNDIAKLEKQIECVLRGLLNDGVLEESELVPIAGSVQTLKPTAGPVTAGSSKSGGLFSSKSKKTAVAGPTTREEPIVGREVARMRKMSIFAVDAEQVFLVPLLDMLVFGAEFTNRSSSAQQLPVLVVNLVDSRGNAVNDTLTRSFVYRFVSEVIDKNCGVQGYEETGEEDSDVVSSEQVVRPDGRISVSACFSYPVMVRGGADLAVLFSLLSDGKPHWSRSFKLNLFDAVNSDEFAIKKYQEPILRAVSHYSRRFSITNLGMLQGSFRIGELLRRFKFRKLEAGENRLHPQDECYSADTLALFWGSLAYVEKSNTGTESKNFLLRTRTSEQLEHLTKVFSDWVTKLNEENSSAAKLSSTNGILIDKKTLSKALLKEVKTLMHLFYLNSQNTLPSSRYDNPSLSKPPVASMPNKRRLRTKWFRVYVDDMSSTDQLFMS